ncbi:MAG: hypothetical protein IT393_04335 [Nitrospirae bacterium]|nr:hypothetical protein [Nitrospirota bacterium]
MKQLGDSFTFTGSPSPAVSGSARPQTYDTGNYRLVVKEPGEKPLPAFLKAFTGTWLKYLAIGILFAAGSVVWAKVKGKKKGPETLNQSEGSDK